MLKNHMKQNINGWLINKKKKKLKHFIDSKAFIEYLNDMDHIFENIEEYNQNNQHKILITLDDMTDDILDDKNLIQ